MSHDPDYEPVIVTKRRSSGATSLAMQAAVLTEVGKMGKSPAAPAVPAPMLLQNQTLPFGWWLPVTHQEPRRVLNQRQKRKARRARQAHGDRRAHG